MIKNKEVIIERIKHIPWGSVLLIHYAGFILGRAKARGYIDEFGLIFLLGIYLLLILKHFSQK